jgi:hypothetical protein
MIRMEEIELAEGMFDTPEKAQEMWNAFHKDEPMLYSRMLNHARSVTADMQKIQGISPITMTTVYNAICAGYMLAFATIKRRRDDIFDRLSKEDQFTMFLAGKAPDRFYSYSVDGLAPDSDLLKAKEARERLSLESLRAALVPILAEDVGDGRAAFSTLRQVEENLHERH